MTDFNLMVTPRRQGVCADGSTELDVLVRVQAPDAPAVGAGRRKHRLNLAFVIDRSGSMNGRPLEEAKRCVSAMAAALQPDDRAALVAYDDEVHLLQSSLPIGDNRVLCELVNGIHSGGTTNLHGGWLRGAGALADTLDENQLARVILLSDGMANEGETHVGTIAKQCAELASTGVTTSTYGLGHSFNEALMVAMAREGCGNHYYGRTADDLMGPFREEFALLENLCARDVRLSVRGEPGVEVKMRNAYPLVGGHAWKLPDLAYDGEAWALLRVRVAPGVRNRIDAEGRLALLEVSASFATLDGGDGELPVSTLRLPVVNDETWNRLEEDATVSRRAMELEAARYQRRVAEAARNHDWARVDQLLGEAETRAGENPWVHEVLDGLRGIAQERDDVMLSKEATYGAARMDSRLAGKDAVFEDLMDAQVEASKRPYLRRKRMQGRREFEDEQ